MCRENDLCPERIIAERVFFFLQSVEREMVLCFP